MKAEDMIWEFLPKGLKGVFEIVRVERTGTAFHVWMDEIRQKAYEDRKNLQIVGKGFTDYCTIQDMPIRGLPTMLHMRKCKWLDKKTGEIFSYDIDYEDEEGTRLSAEFDSYFLLLFVKGNKVVSHATINRDIASYFGLDSCNIYNSNVKSHVKTKLYLDEHRIVRQK